ncbi:hypothetical protein IFM89_038343 [Coptis chinensis]|uniref:RBR-type E3 ubiquitin transferase n=1 Tax=Coptis chinensis TaxID=261450 RepID=A0A835I3W5_9MAGN|nr:hypothetical protein IFM89_038343 [Coptis chinensis]
MREKLVDSESKSRSSCALDSEGAESVYTIKDCVDLLNQVSDLLIGSELYMDALDIFKKKSNREFFVSIPPEMDSEGEEYMDSNGDFEDNEDEYEGSDYDAAECSSDEYYVSENDDDHEDCEPNHSVLTESDVRKRQDDIITKMVSACCGHLFCKLCWERYVSTSIKDGPGCLTLRCPEAKCPAAVGQDIVDKLVSDEEKKKYSCFLLKSYVDVNKNIKWCPAPDCDNAVDFVAGSESYDVACNCKCNFCWNCLEETHCPVKCDTVAKWMIKNSAESKTLP